MSVCIADFLTARVKEDPDLPADDVQTKLGIIDLFQALDSDPAAKSLGTGAWIVAREIIRLMCVRYASHPDYDQAWVSSWLDAPQRVVLGIDQPEATVTL